MQKSSLLKPSVPLPFPSNAVDVECKLDGPGQRLSMASMQAAQMCLSQHSSAALALQQWQQRNLGSFFKSHISLEYIFFSVLM